MLRGGMVVGLRGMNNMIRWRNIDEERPADGQDCLTMAKGGVVQGAYDATENNFGAYLFGMTLEWYATQWVPADEVLP